MKVTVTSILRYKGLEFRTTCLSWMRVYQRWIKQVMFRHRFDLTKRRDVSKTFSCAVPYHYSQRRKGDVSLACVGGDQLRLNYNYMCERLRLYVLSTLDLGTHDISSFRTMPTEILTVVLPVPPYGAWRTVP